MKRCGARERRPGPESKGALADEPGSRFVALLSCLYAVGGDCFPPGESGIGNMQINKTEKARSSSLFQQEGRIRGPAALTVGVFLDQTNAIQWGNRWLQVGGIIDPLSRI